MIICSGCFFNIYPPSVWRTRCLTKPPTYRNFFPFDLYGRIKSGGAPNGQSRALGLALVLTFAETNLSLSNIRKIHQLLASHSAGVNNTTSDCLRDTRSSGQECFWIISRTSSFTEPNSKSEKTALVFSCQNSRCSRLGSQNTSPIIWKTTKSRQNAPQTARP